MEYKEIEDEEDNNKLELDNLPYLALVEVFRQADNTARMQLSQTCTRFRRILVGSTDRTLERRRYNPERIMITMPRYCRDKNKDAKAKIKRSIHYGRRLDICGFVKIGKVHSEYRTAKELIDRLNEATVVEYYDKAQLRIHDNTSPAQVKNILDALINAHFDKIDLRVMDNDHIKVPFGQGNNIRRWIMIQFLRNPNIISANPRFGGKEYQRCKELFRKWGQLHDVPMRYKHKKINAGYCEVTVLRGMKNGRETIYWQLEHGISCGNPRANG